MDQLLEFLTNHPILTMALLAIIGGLVWTMIGPGARKSTRLSPMDATRLINHEDAVVIDVRGDGDFSNGHILNALNVPHQQLAARIAKLEKYRNRPIIATCRSGHQSAAACSVLRKHGFERVYNLHGGILAWQNENLPLTKK